MVMTALARMSLALVACLLFTACSSEGSSPISDCTSHYEPVASASTWDDLKAEMLANRDWGRVVSLRTQARGEEADRGPGDKEVVRVMDLLNRKGGRLIQVDVWRTDDGWRAGAWSQCID